MSPAAAAAAEPLGRWLRELCAPAMPPETLSAVVVRCAAEGFETVGELAAASLTEWELRELGLTAMAPRKRIAAALAEKSSAAGGEEAAAGISSSIKRVVALGCGLGFGISIGLAMGGLLAVKLVAFARVKPKDGMALLRAARGGS